MQNPLAFSKGVKGPTTMEIPCSQCAWGLNKQCMLQTWAMPRVFMHSMDSLAPNSALGEQ